MSICKQSHRRLCHNFKTIIKTLRRATYSVFALAQNDTWLGQLSFCLMNSLSAYR